jgi:hypothetical protein
MRLAVHFILAWAAGTASLGGADPATSRAIPTQAMEEYRLKAAFVSSFAGFVEWPAPGKPPDATRKSRDPISICVLGENPFGSALEQAVSGKIVQDRPLTVRWIGDVRQAAGCQILFVSSSERKRLRSILKDSSLTGVLTVGDTSNFTSEGGVIDLEVEGDKIRILINMEAAEQNSLRISSRLLSLARIVKK